MSVTESLDEAYARRDAEDETIELNVDHVHRAWGLIDLVCEGDAFETYGADYTARDHLAERLVEEGHLPGDRLR